MGLKAKEIQRTDILHLESEMNNLWGELNTSNISNAVRVELEKRLTDCEEQFKAVLGGQLSCKDLETYLHNCDVQLAESTIQQAQNEISKIEHNSSCFLALENIRRELKEGHLSPIKARHEVKSVMRKRS